MAVTSTAPQAESQDDLAKAYAQQQGAPSNPAPATTSPVATPAATPSAENQEDLAKEYAAQSNTGAASGTTGAGFASTVGSDLYQAGKSIVALPFREAAHIVTGGVGASGQQAEDAEETHKTAVYQQFKNDFHAGNYTKAFSGLMNLFDPRYDNPNDPISQMMASQWESSAQAKDRMIEAAKKGDTLGVIQHGAGVLPVASQVDAAMVNYQDNPTRENLAHVVSAAIPAFVPALVKGAAKAVSAVSESAGLAGPETNVNPMAPTEQGGVPVRQSVANPSLANKVAEGLANKGDLQKFDITQTQPAARAAVNRIAGETLQTSAEPIAELAKAGKVQALNNYFEAVSNVQEAAAKVKDVTDELEELKNTPDPKRDVLGPDAQPIDDPVANKAKADKAARLMQAQGAVQRASIELGKAQDAAEAASKIDPEAEWKDLVDNMDGDFGAAAGVLKNKLSPLYEKAGEAYKAADSEKQAAFRRGDVAAEKAAESAKRQAFENANGVGSYESANSLYSKLDDMDKINKVFNAAKVIKRTPEAFVTAGKPDVGIIDGAALRDAVRQLGNDGERGGPSTFERAGVSDTVVQKLQDLGAALERSKVKPDMKASGMFSRIMQGTKNLTAGKQLAYLMTHEVTLDEALNALKSGASKASKAASAGNIMRGPTHVYDPATGTLTAIQ